MRNSWSPAEPDTSDPILSICWAKRGYEVTVVDDLSRGHEHNVDKARLHKMNLLETDALSELMKRGQVGAVIHFAAYIAEANRPRNRSCTLRIMSAGPSRCSPRWNGPVK